ncbi:hypothetical protein [Microvirga brassicacearum]|uniref:Glutamine amidotransferase n=1 Tax=Microvirga brassicacearum TaxID=2580413 RepID=A0A5N3P797_9HYPH|nr:hypothetical protein [Microvirga brassicacearum]KAB0265604.1 hypothetical protein FEZ63_17645 [Microvirga brassicacearum]
MYILEIAGKAVAITNADQDQAHELFMSEDFKDDLKSFSSEGKPLWDGSAPLKIRRATDDEIESFDEAMEDDDDLDEEDDEEDGIDVMFLALIDEMDDDTDDA